jgi:poly(A) polymerase
VDKCVYWNVVTDEDASGLVRGLADRLGGHYAHLHNKASWVVANDARQEVVFLSPGPIASYEVTELLNLQTIREEARKRRLI